MFRPLSLCKWGDLSVYRELKCLPGTVAINPDYLRTREVKEFLHKNGKSVQKVGDRRELTEFLRMDDSRMND